MPQPIPQAVEWLFIGTTAVAGFFFLQANRKVKSILVLLIAWLILQTVLAEKGFYLDQKGIPPRMLFLILPPLLIITGCFISVKGRSYIDSLDPGQLAWLHVVRVPVEVVLYLLMIHKLVPSLMTFEGRNFDIVSGLTAPFIAVLGYRPRRLSKAIMIGWNIICLGLLVNVVYYAVLSAPTAFQQYAFDQPNIAVLHFPFVWLPAFIVPLVLFSHLVCLRQLMKKTT